MRLTTIKLSGFKSFVDPTTLHLPSNLTVVVGPNGCGKSNIIDAVRWVMGESAASRLRGDALTDVIFSGAAGRKPVSQASVELLFDNSCGTIGGEFAGFNELSVRRVVGRDGSSSYFLNGSRCRKRDVTELFLGTGLGPRSYAIIEQGMISQVIDAKPDELRVHLEEAAGISLYKERRRETLGRISQTRENLERLDDLRGEIGRQLEHLQQQAEQATAYRQLQQQRQHSHVGVLALQWQRAHTEHARLLGVLAQGQQALEQAREHDAQQVQQRQALQAQAQKAKDALDHAQAWVYTHQAEAARLQQALEHARALIARQQHDHAQTDSGLQALQQQLQHDADAAQVLERAQQELLPQLEQAAQLLAQTTQVQAQAEDAHRQWQQQWEQVVADGNAAGNALERETASSGFVSRQQGDLLQRQQALTQTLASLQGDEHDAAHARCEAALAEQAQRLQQAREAAAAATAHRSGLEREVQATHEQVQHWRERSQVLAGQVSALQTLQAAALGDDDAALQAWLQAQGLADALRLGNLLQVADGWEQAVETCLGPWLEAVVVPAGQLPALQAALPAGCRVLLVEDRRDALSLPAGCLALQVDGPQAARRLLADVQCADHLDMGPAAAAGSGQWQVTRDGQLQGPGCLHSGGAADQQGVLLRQQQLHSQQLVLADIGQQLAVAQARESERRGALHDCRQQQEQAQADLLAIGHAHAEAQAALTLAQGQRLAREQARTQAARDLDTVATQLQALQREAASAGHAQADAAAQVALCAQRRLALEQERQPLVDALQQARADLQRVGERQQALVLERETGRARQQAVEQALARGRQQQQALGERLRALDVDQQREAGSVQALQAQCEASALQQQQAQAQLEQARGQWQAIAAQDEQQQLQARQQQAWWDEQRETLVQHRLALQAAELSLSHLQEQIQAAGLEQMALQLHDTAGMELETLQRQLQQLDARLRRMEPVNLAAIDEFAQASERAGWLDGQHADLSSALETLETAMARIDRETRSRFKETFDKVNDGLQSLYPRLFGGGHAQLELTEADLLDAGVVLMARPPGKKISSLSLLSGGEKAMTAVALVFAIFQLNPAPFCLLDEVDAPLDESNVARLAAMLREMSGSVQFLSVSHNKATMEAADQLCGVTMREPGVSRLVSVDLTEASRLAGAA